MRGVDGAGEPILRDDREFLGLRFADALMARGLRVIAPSRFGYLRSDFPADP